MSILENTKKTSRTFTQAVFKRGMRLGKYRLTKHITSTELSHIWKAYDEIHCEWVALKIPYSTSREDQEACEEALLQEIRIKAKLSHPNVVTLKNADRWKGILFLVTPLAKETLEERLQRRLSTEHALSYIQQFLKGLAYAHEQRCMHRDLKPANLFIYDDGQLRVADFGLARRSRHTMVSATGSGTMLYGAPEQMHGYPCFASDVFSAGLIIYQILTGKLINWPFEWTLDREKALISKVPPEFARHVRKSLHVDYKKRFRNAIEMQESFSKAVSVYHKTKHAKPKTTRRKASAGQWKAVRKKECLRSYKKVLSLDFDCPECSGPISEFMQACPWCGFQEISFAKDTIFSHFCAGCKHGVSPDWLYCPWCWGPSLKGAEGIQTHDPGYRFQCKSCKGGLLEGMKYCPWCHTKCTHQVRINGLPDRCGHCKGSVLKQYWEHCAWCAEFLTK